MSYSSCNISFLLLFSSGLFTSIRRSRCMSISGFRLDCFSSTAWYEHYGFCMRIWPFSTPNSGRLGRCLGSGHARPNSCLFRTIRLESPSRTHQSAGPLANTFSSRVIQLSRYKAIRLLLLRSRRMGRWNSL